MRGDEHDHDHHERNSRKYQDYGGDAHEDPVLACRCRSFNEISGLGGR
jgi:hypothetical protein